MSDDLSPPADLTPEEAAHWQFYAGELHARGLFTPSVRGALASYCWVRATIDRLRRLQREPEYRDLLVNVTVDGAGNEHAKGASHPLLIRIEAQIKVARQLESDLGLNVASAIRLPSAPADDDDAPTAPVHDFFRGLKRVSA